MFAINHSSTLENCIVMWESTRERNHLSVIFVENLLFKVVSWSSIWGHTRVKNPISATVARRHLLATNNSKSTLEVTQKKSPTSVTFAEKHLATTMSWSCIRWLTLEKRSTNVHCAAATLTIRKCWNNISWTTRINPSQSKTILKNSSCPLSTQLFLMKEKEKSSHKTCPWRDPAVAILCFPSLLISSSASWPRTLPSLDRPVQSWPRPSVLASTETAWWPPEGGPHPCPPPPLHPHPPCPRPPPWPPCLTAACRWGRGDWPCHQSLTLTWRDPAAWEADPLSSPTPCLRNHRLNLCNVKM